MVGIHWNTCFLLGWPVFRGNLLVLGSVYFVKFVVPFNHGSLTNPPRSVSKIEDRGGLTFRQSLGKVKIVDYLGMTSGCRKMHQNSRKETQTNWSFLGSYCHRDFVGVILQHNTIVSATMMKFCDQDANIMKGIERERERETSISQSLRSAIHQCLNAKTFDYINTYARTYVHSLIH